MGRDKKGLEMAITTVILIILSIAVLTILVIFFNSQSGILTSRVETQTTQTNVDETVSFCNSLAARDARYAYCCETKEIRLEDETNYLTCNEARTEAWSGERITPVSCEGTSCT